MRSHALTCARVRSRARTVLTIKGKTQCLFKTTTVNQPDTQVRYASCCIARISWLYQNIIYTRVEHSSVEACVVLCLNRFYVSVFVYLKYFLTSATDALQQQPRKDDERGFSMSQCLHDERVWRGEGLLEIPPRQIRSSCKQIAVNKMRFVPKLIDKITMIFLSI